MQLEILMDSPKERIFIKMFLKLIHKSMYILVGYQCSMDPQPNERVL